MSDMIDSLGLEIRASSVNATKSINSLKRALMNLDSAMSAFNGSQGYAKGFTLVASSINKLSSAVDSIDSGKLKSISSSIKRLGGIDGKNADFSKIVNGLNSINSVQVDGRNADAISKVGMAMNGLSQSSKAADGLPKVANALKSFDGVRIPNIANISALGDGVKKLSNATKASENIPKIASALKRLSDLKSVPNMAWIKPFADGISKLGGKYTAQAIERLPRLATIIRQLLNELRQIQGVDKNTVKLVNSLATLTKAGYRVGSSVGNASKGLNLFSASAVRATKSSFSLASAIGKVYATYWLLFRFFGGLGKSIEEASHLTELQNVIDVTFGDMTSKVDEFTKTSIEKFGITELSVKQFAGRFQAMGTAMGIPTQSISKMGENLERLGVKYAGSTESMADMSLTLTRLTADLASFYDISQEDVAVDLESIFTGMTRPLRTYGLDLTQATLKEWAMKNGLDANIESMSQAEKTLLRYQYVLANSAAAHNDFERTSHTWANQVRMLKQNWQALNIVIGQGLIQALKPFVMAMNKALISLTEFAKKVLNALGKIFGWEIDISTTGVKEDLGGITDEVEDLGGGLGGATQKAKELKKQLMGFDKLNIITLPDDNKGGGSGGGSGSGAGGAGEANDISYNFKKGTSLFESEIDNLYELGEYIGQAITNGLKKINWDSVYESARNFGKGLADFLNGLISPELFGEVGHSIAGALNTVIYASLSFAENFDAKDFGKSIAEGINRFFLEFDTKSLAKSINKWVDNIKETILTAIVNTKWNTIFSKIGDFIGEIELDTVAIVIGAVLIKKILGLSLAANALAVVGTAVSKSIASAIAKKIGVEIAADATIGEALSTALSNKFQSKGFAKYTKVGIKVAITVTAVLAVGEALNKGVDNAFDKILKDNGFSEEDIKDFKNGKNYIEKPFNLNIIQSFKILTNEKANKEFLESLEFYREQVNKWLEEKPLSSITIPIVDAFFDFKKITIAKPKNIGSIYNDIRYEIGKILAKVTKGGIELFINAGELGAKIGASILDGLIDFPPKLIGFLIKCFTDLPGVVEAANKFFSDLWEDVKGVFKKSDGSLLDPIIKGWKDGIKGFSPVKEIKKSWKEVTKYWKTKPTLEKIKTTYEDFKKKVSDKWNDVIKYWKSKPILEQVKTTYEDMKSKVLDKWNKVVSYWSSKPVLSQVKTTYEDIKAKVKEKWDAVVNYWSTKGSLAEVKISVASIKAKVKEKWDDLKAWWSRTKDSLSSFSWKVPKIKVELEWNTTNMLGKALKKVGFKGMPVFTFKTYAQGGFPNVGSFMVAGEKGAELVGNINGRTGVASNMEITGIRDAINDTSNTQVELLRQQNSLLYAILQKETGISSNEIFSAVQSKAKEYTNRTGDPAFT